MNRRSFLKAVAAACLVEALPVTSPIVAAVLKTFPRWVRTVEQRIDLMGMPLMVHYQVGSMATGTVWEFMELLDVDKETMAWIMVPDLDALLGDTDARALHSFIKAGAL